MFTGSSGETLSLFPTGLACPHFPISEILLVTQNFNDELVIGQGGFGKVYKGTLKNGTKSVVAIKRLDAGSAQGPTEFWAEVEMLSMLRHCNLVPLIGYCNDNREMILVYEYMPNGTLEDHLHKLHTPLSFSQRLKMYDNWAAKISDFGLSKISPIDKLSTGVNTLIKGTFGYFDPNYFSTGRLTRKSDVFSFGVILLEVLCKKRAMDSSLDEEQWSLVEWAQDFMKGGKLKDIIDPYLKGEISRKCLNGYAKLVDGCLHRSPKQRITMRL
ncbi:receptor-like protein kinase ANXUR1 [Helianthus annuus]|uniref:receptor-like protein kinase ANXUR1 n=1 Tax=Helianthus annuus TaxID=4232 RepID=UPI000B8F6D0A|nr:receptor-like protein kinase ANXUR1 [Helianthus annuus]